MSWLMWTKEEHSPSIRILCFHYAGGSASFYFNWRNKVKTNAQLMAVQLPGRDNRITEPFISSLEVAVNEIVEQIKPYLSDSIVFFGHSLGAYVSFEVARKLQQKNMPLPKHLIVSGARAPQYAYTGKSLHCLPDKEFIESIKGLKGFSEIILQDQESLSVYIPRLKADWRLFSDYKFNSSIAPPLTCHLKVLSGLEDEEVSYEQAIAWEEHSVKSFSSHFLPGGHFFVNSCQERVLNIINQWVLSQN